MIGIISDIHGNISALKAVINRLEELNIDKIICLGDIVGYYSEVNECCDLLREKNIHCLMGNHDWYLVSGEGCPRSNSANQCIDYQKKIISKENLQWLSTLKPTAFLHNINMVHGGWNDPLEEYMIPSDSYFSNIRGQFYTSGHTHVPCIWKSKGKIYCNPGSVGQPRDGNPEASFAIFNGIDKFFLHRINYDIESTQNLMKIAGFTSYFYENLTNGTRIGGKIDSLKL